ncbi:esterase-like activity of phytase family protein, partial [Loigolactobacillus coryniformis]|uniref:esterase-like activity of phytase family protein n=1 Tax=Loigolactobacillus coryniformis TaxID=1610 RepID=UPI00201A8BB6
FRPGGQFAYRTEPSSIRLQTAGTGVSELALLPDGELLVLERVVGFLGLSAKIFRADVRGATDITRVVKLEGAEFTPAGKKELFSRA